MMENLPNGIDPDGFAGFSQSFNMGRGYAGYGITSVAVGLGYHLFEKHNLDRNIFYDQKILQKISLIALATWMPEKKNGSMLQNFNQHTISI